MTSSPNLQLLLESDSTRAAAFTNAHNNEAIEHKIHATDAALHSAESRAPEADLLRTEDEQDKSLRRDSESTVTLAHSATATFAFSTHATIPHDPRGYKWKPIKRIPYLRLETERERNRRLKRREQRQQLASKSLRGHMKREAGKLA